MKLNIEDVLKVLLFLCGILILILFIVAISSDFVTTTDKVPCLDERNREFENELCYEKVQCTHLPFSIPGLEECDNIKNIKESLK